MAIDERPSTVSAPPVDSPYKGLANFTEADAAFFFGREREREVIIANLRSRRVTLLYGASGVGKSSLLRAGVIPELAAVADENAKRVGTPEFIPVVFSAWRDDPLIGVIDAIEKSAQSFAREPLRLSRGDSIVTTIHDASEAIDAYLLVILDQFEEYFLYHTGEDGAGTFAQELPRAISRPGLQAGFLISIRDDAVAKLDGFKDRMPGLFDTLIRVEHLDSEAGREAILRPVDEYNARVEPDRRVSVDPKLIDAVLMQVRTGQITLEQAGHGSAQLAGGESTSDRVETPYLQLVMARLWDELGDRKPRALTVETLETLGGAQEIVRTHLDAALRNFSPAEQYVVADLFHQLVTPSGTKIAHSAEDLAQYVDLPAAAVAVLLEKLAAPDTRIVRALAPPAGNPGPPRYEIFHDVLAPSILDWRSRKSASRRARAILRRRVRRIVALIGIAVTALIVWLAISAINARNEAEKSAARARSAEKISSKKDLAFTAQLRAVLRQRQAQSTLDGYETVEQNPGIYCVSSSGTPETQRSPPCPPTPAMMRSAQSAVASSTLPVQRASATVAAIVAGGSLIPTNSIRSTDLFDYAQGARVLATSGVGYGNGHHGTRVSTGPIDYSTAAAMFGGGLPTGRPESDGMGTDSVAKRSLVTFFEDGRPLGFRHWIEWKPRNAVELMSVGLFAEHDTPVNGYLYRRAFSEFVLYAREREQWVELVKYNSTLPYAQGSLGRSLAVCLPVAPTRAQIFKAVFVQATNILDQFSGPRVVGLDGNDATCSQQYPAR